VPPLGVWAHSSAARGPRQTARVYLWLKDKQYQDFECEFEFKVNKGGNSGFYFHVGNLKSPVATGIEVQLYDSGSKKPDAKLSDHDACGLVGSPAFRRSSLAPKRLKAGLRTGWIP